MPYKEPTKPLIPEKRIWVHQIFGLLGDTELPPLFRDNQKLTKKWCRVNDYSYRCWDEKSCNQLLKNYPEFQEFYNSVKYPIMRVDIIRFIILHYYGGLYLDMDCRPVLTTKLDETYKFAVANTQTNKQKPYEMEVLYSKPCNPLLTDFIRYMKTQVIEKDKIKVYDTWKCRYVYQTTGPKALCRFLKGKEFNTYNLNNPSYDGDKSMNITGYEHFISHISCSYNI